MNRIYRFLLRLYPSKFRQEFEEQMFLDFLDLAGDARKKGRLSLVMFCLRELVDFPFNLTKIHFREGYLFTILRSEPLNSGLRGAIGFGAGFACSTWGLSRSSSFIYQLMVSSLSARFHELFQIDISNQLWWMVLAIHFALTGTAFGLSLGLFLGNRTTLSRYMIAGALAWMIPEITYNVLVFSLGLEYYRNGYLAPILGYSLLILAGAFLSASYRIAASDRKEPLRYLATGLVVYPLGTYLVIRLLLSVLSDINVWFFLSLQAFIVISIMSVVGVASSGNRRQIFVILTGALGYFLLHRMLFYVAHYIFGHSTLEVAMATDVLILPSYEMAIYKAILGALFGLLLGVMAGYQRKNSQLLIATAN